MKMMNILREMPVFKKMGKQVVDANTGIMLKRVDTADVDENLVLYVNRDVNLFVAVGWFMLWFVNDPEYTNQLKKGNADQLYFPVKVRIFQDAPITDIWKKKYGGRNTDKIIGACQGWVNDEEKTVYINMLSVRPGWKRNGIASHMFKGLKNQYPGYEFTVSKTTDDGRKFVDSIASDQQPKRDDRDYNPI